MFLFGIGEIVCFYFFKENIVIAVYIILLMYEKNINELKQGFFIGVILHVRQEGVTSELPAQGAGERPWSDWKRRPGAGR